MSNAGGELIGKVNHRGRGRQRENGKALSDRWENVLFVGTRTVKRKPGRPRLGERQEEENLSSERGGGKRG